jgi:predicted enzyme related to lactoylglutathione lyase
MASSERAVTVGWFEIPVKDMGRAILFYNRVFDITLSKQDFGGLLMAWFPMHESAKGAGGSLILNKNYTPSHEGTLIYFSSVDAENEIKRVEKAGGKILQEKTQISPDIGYMALFEDTEGNRIAVHSRK